MYLVSKRWFKALPPRSVVGWGELAYQLIVQFFFTSKELPCTSHTLALVKQQKGEKLSDFLTCFYKEAALVPNLPTLGIMHLVVEALLPGPFKCSLTKTLLTTMQEIHHRSEKHVNLED